MTPCVSLIWRFFVMSGERFMEIRDDEFEMANQRAADRLSKTPVATSVRYDGRIRRVVIRLPSGLDVSFSPRDVQGLEHAKPDDLRQGEISPSGLGIHFPALDADLYLPALLEGFLGSKHWVASEAGKRGGQASTPAKAAAARQNGKLGGRPRKSKRLFGNSSRRLSMYSCPTPRFRVPRCRAGNTCPTYGVDAGNRAAILILTPNSAFQCRHSGRDAGIQRPGMANFGLAQSLIKYLRNRRATVHGTGFRRSMPE
jgi:hypothetical protein